MESELSGQELSQCFCDCGDGMRGDGWVVSESLEPKNIGFAAEPRQLSLGVVAVALLGRGGSFGKCHLAAQNGAGLLVSERVEGAGRVSIFRDEAAGFFQQAAVFRFQVKHRFRPGVDAGIQSLAVRVESDAQEAEPVSGSRPFSMPADIG